MNPALQLAVRNAVCQDCRLGASGQAEGKDVCVTGQGPTGAEVMVVTKFPVGPKSRAELERYMTEAGIDPSGFMWCAALKCRVWSMDPTKTDMKACKPYLHREIEFVKPKYIIAFGGEAMFAVTGRAGVMKYRGRVEEVGGATAFCTIAPSMVARNPGYRDGFLADLRYFRNLMDGGTGAGLPPHHVPRLDQCTDVTSKAALRALLAALRTCDAYSYDIESTGASEHADGAAVVSLAITTAGPDGMDSAHVWRVPLFHPESPWQRIWRQVIRALHAAMCAAPRRIAHNAKFDTRWLHHFGMPDLLPTFDTIIALALLDENAPKGLKPSAQQRLGADPWGIDTKDLLNTPLPDVLEYNGLDTWHTLRLYYLLRDELKNQPRLGRLFLHLMMPAVQELVEVERRGVYVDREVLATNAQIAQSTLDAVEERLMALVPDWADIPANLNEVNFGPSNFARWWLFDYLGLPILARGKEKDDGSPGAPSMAEAVMLDLADLETTRGANPNVPSLMLERALWNKRTTGFFTPWSEMLTRESRIHTTFKPWGTVTGRLSSGKEDEEKVTAKTDRRGVNIQQVPRVALLRGVFGAPPGWSFVEADYSQIELRIAAYLARETTMLHLYATGQDIHMAMAMRMTGKPASDVTKEERKRAKAVNFGFLYGMGWAKFIQTAWLNYQVRVTEEESRAFRRSFFEQFPVLPKWHARQRRLAAKYKRVETPLGRIRHLPDIDSPSPDVRSEAERQAINSPVQGMASDMALLSLVHVSRKFRKAGLRAYAIGTVHDAVNFEIHNDDLPAALPVIKRTMENLPLGRLFDVHVDVPIVADVKVGTHWGGAHEIPQSTWDSGLLDEWLKENVAA